MFWKLLLSEIFVATLHNGNQKIQMKFAHKSPGFISHFLRIIVNFSEDLILERYNEVMEIRIYTGNVQLVTIIK